MENLIHSFLMIGQSNMAGRGFIRDVKPIYDEQIRMLVNGRWQTMSEPMNFDRPTSGVSLAASFAGTWRLNNENQQIGLIPCADGGSSLDDWAVGGVLYENAVFQTKLAQRTSSLTGILWHQGENDSFACRSETYYDKLAVIIAALRQELEAPDIPFITGGLGDFLSTGRYGKYFTEYKSVNRELLRFANTNPNAYFVSAAELTANPDGLHFDALSLRKFGIRYFEAFKHQKNVPGPITGENELINTIQDRPFTKNEKASLLEISFGLGNLSLEDFENQLSTITAFDS
ncbi:sialate O-acetylesterase [Dyadobacter subterraneus]|uniref:Sialate O-acetylesterase n=1 Tax=Dyadobacter subterraneus TaxID=2773304 RepID=A0ABR9WDP7_9BACT|nr:sialate O-acetylesterase [Dyadobacter subterraneus]MBE9463616.1 sialate O-acetylesterase [Dyadobacter subterraneus]